MMDVVEEVPMEKQDLVKSLVGKKILKASFEKDSLHLEFDDGSTLVASARSGIGADSNWYNWTEVLINSQRIIDE